MKFRMLWFLIIAGMFAIGFIQSAFAWNPLTDIRENTIWTFGKTAEVGEAVKLFGAGNLEPGDTATSMLAGIADYRFLSLSYGGTRINQNDASFTDTAKLGFRLTSFFDLFKNSPTPAMEWMRDLNVGPSVAVPLISRSHPVAVFLDVNYVFGGNPFTSVAP